MLQAEFEALKKGEKVVFTQSSLNSYGMFPPVGTQMSRRVTFMDDNETNAFEWVIDGVLDYHFFTADEVDFIKE